jgi:hypothetical protein
MLLEVRKKLVKSLRMLRDDRLRLHVGVGLFVVGLALFGMYYPRAAHTPSSTSSETSKSDRQAQVAGSHADATYNPTDTPTHAGAPEQGQRMAHIPGSDPEACEQGTSAGKTSAPVGLTGTIDVTLPPGCTSGSYEVRTADGHEVQWAPLFGAFMYRDDSSFNDHGDSAAAAVQLPFNKEGHTGSGITYTVSAKTTAKGTYENALYVTDPEHEDGGYKVILRITVE